MPGSDAAAYLLGRLVQEGREPLAVLRVTPGSLPSLGGVHALAVTAGRLWLAQPRLLGGADVASVPLADVGPVTVRPGSRGRPRVAVEVGGRALRYRGVDDVAACEALAAAVRAGREHPGD